jgi:hypothetical protein
MYRTLALLTLAAGFVLTAGPVLATPAPVPEPATMSLIGVGIAAAYVADQLRRRRK